jgi:predicted oxidoreductase (fatty acid repression mutant protein)
MNSLSGFARTMSSQLFLDIIAKRRTYYQLGAKSPITDTRIQEIIENVILNVPSAFNSQTVRIILLVKEEHKKLWEIVKEVLRGVVPEDSFTATEKKVKGFQAAYGTVGPTKFQNSFALAHHQSLGSVFRSSSHHSRLSGKVCSICR